MTEIDVREFGALPFLMPDIDPIGPEEQGFQIIQDGLVVVEASGVGSWKEILHYAAQYAEDGKITIRRLQTQKAATPKDDGS